MKINVFLFWILILVSCNHSHHKSSSLKHNLRDTIEVEKIINEFQQADKNNLQIVQLKFFDQEQNRTSLRINDTFFVKTIFKSSGLKKLNSNYQLHLDKVNGDFQLLKTNSRNVFKIFTTENSGQVSIDVSLSSKNTVFKSKNRITDTVFICRMYLIVKEN